MQQSSALNFSLPVDPDELQLSVAHPADGRALRYHADEFAIGWIGTLSDAINRRPELTSAARLFDREMLKLHLENALHTELLGVCRAYMRRRYLQLRGQMISKPVECPFELLELVANHWPQDTIPLVPRRDLVPLRRRLGRMRLDVTEALWRATRPMPSARVDHPVVAIELVEGSDPCKKADAFWLAAGTVEPRHVLFVLEHHNKSFLDVDKELAQIRALGAQCVALHPSVSANGKVPMWVSPRMPQWLRTYCASLTGSGSPLERWIRRTLREFAQAVWRWESFFRHFNVAIYQQFTEALLDTAPRRLAIDRVGGIEVGKMRSQFFDRSSASFYFQHEVGFVWHDNVAEVLKHGRTRTSDVVAVGYPWDHLFGSMAAEANSLRQRLMKPGVALVLAIYDNHAHINGVFSSYHLEIFYSHLVNLARHRPSVALLVKSKKPQILRQMPQIQTSLRQLEAEGRCLVLDEPLASVVPAALAADLMVALPAATAACEAALAGRAVLMYDPSGSIDHPFSGQNKGIMFTDFGQFCRALEQVLEEPHGTLPSKSSCHIDLIDPFRDGRAARRAAAFIAGFLEARKKGLEKANALHAAYERYRETLSVPRIQIKSDRAST